MNFSAYLLELVAALEAQNGSDLAYYLRPTSPHGKDLVKEFRNPTVRVSLRLRWLFICCGIARVTFLLWREPGESMGRDRYSICLGVYACRKETSRRGFQGAIPACLVRHLRGPIEYSRIHSRYCRLFFRYFTSNSGWTLPALFSILRDLRDLAFDVS